MNAEEHLAQVCISLEEGVPLGEWRVLSEAKPLATCSQSAIPFLGFSPVNGVHGCKPRSLHPCLLAQALLFLEELLTSFGLTPVSQPHNHSLKKGLDGLLAMADGDTAQRVRCTIVSSLLVLQLKLE